MIWVVIEVVKTIDEIGTMELRETSEGVGVEVEEEEETIDLSLNVLWTTWFNLVTKNSSF